MKQRLSATTAALLATISCLMIGGSIVTLYGTVLRPHTFHQQATVVASNFLTAQVQGTLQATAQAFASATAIQNLYTQTVSHPPAYSDPLNAQNASNWNVTQSPAHSCTFINSAYHVSASTRNVSTICPAPVGTLTNFAFQVQMKILKGDSSGIFFGLDSYFTTPKNIDYFGADAGGDYIVANISNGQFHDISHGIQSDNSNSSSVVLLSVIVLDGMAYLYMNQQLVYSFSNTTYATSGYIGLYAAYSLDPVEAAFNNAQIWKL